MNKWGWRNMNGLMRMDGLVDGWMDEWMRMDGLMNEWGWIDWWINEWGWMDGLMNRGISMDRLGWMND